MVGASWTEWSTLKRKPGWPKGVCGGHSTVGGWALDQSRFFLAWSLTPPWAPGTLGLESGPETFCEIFSVTLMITQVRNHALEATLVVQ